MTTNNKEVFERIYQQNQGMVLQMCLGFVKGDEDSANDLSQEVFISVWNNLHKFKGLSSYKTWIYRITVNTCLQFVKKENKKGEIRTQEFKEVVEETQDEASHKNPISDLYKAIGQLKKVDRLLIMMVLENEDNDTIAEIMGISAINVRVKIHRVKKRLEKILKNI
ncbi:RNA polymerase sigma factor [Tenacibaculum xiamenense]|uniref:RNA polymerase sigma factor n=1 Tax=Tenacibaculum xiamenense TaxID=1261553 RepID=UPI0038948139